MTAVATRAAEPITEIAIEVFRFADAAAMVAQTSNSRIVAYLRDRELRLFLAASRHTLDARILGGVTSTVELIDFGPDLPVVCAGALRISADGRGVRIAFLARDRRVLAEAPFDDDAFAQLAGDTP